MNTLYMQIAQKTIQLLRDRQHVWRSKNLIYRTQRLEIHSAQADDKI
jgi:hypothetical protein